MTQNRTYKYLEQGTGTIETYIVGKMTESRQNKNVPKEIERTEILRTEPMQSPPDLEKLCDLEDGTTLCREPSEKLSELDQFKEAVKISLKEKQLEKELHLKSQRNTDITIEYVCGGILCTANGMYDRIDDTFVVICKDGTKYIYPIGRDPFREDLVEGDGIRAISLTSNPEVLLYFNPKIMPKPPETRKAYYIPDPEDKDAVERVKQIEKQRWDELRRILE